MATVAEIWEKSNTDKTLDGMCPTPAFCAQADEHLSKWCKEPDRQYLGEGSSWCNYPEYVVSIMQDEAEKDHLTKQDEPGEQYRDDREIFTIP